MVSPLQADEPKEESGRCHPSLGISHILKELHSAEGVEFAVNYPPATLFDKFLQERLYLKNVTPRTLVWYRVAFNSYRASLAVDAPVLPTRATLQQFLIQLRDRGIRPVTCNTYLAAMNAFCAWLHEEQHIPE